ncbi:NUDIX domain-containing protein [Ensifer sp. M14]|uniref:NUDIX hydrolase n=1 Tax=Ensifer sp. M14 TaxID=2203782 RepID=UPI000E1D81DA|nr:NUDIX domain-containing protein [Ensifer sp. M14]
MMPKPPELASSVILERDGHYLLVRRANPPSADMYAFPGGRAEPGETPEETALRELQEETGIHARNPVLFETYDLPGKESEGRHFFLSVFRAQADAAAVAVASDDAADLGWFTPDEIFALPIPDSVRECVEKLAAEAAANAKTRKRLETAADSDLMG